MGFRRRHVQGQFGLTEVVTNNKHDNGGAFLFTMPNVQSIPKTLKPVVESICYIAKHKKIEDEMSQVMFLVIFISFVVLSVMKCRTLFCDCHCRLQAAQWVRF